LPLGHLAVGCKAHHEGLIELRLDLLWNLQDQIPGGGAVLFPEPARVKLAAGCQAQSEKQEPKREVVPP